MKPIHPKKSEIKDRINATKANKIINGYPAEFIGGKKFFKSSN